MKTKLLDKLNTKIEAGQLHSVSLHVRVVDAKKFVLVNEYRKQKNLTWNELIDAMFGALIEDLNAVGNRKRSKRG